MAKVNELVTVFGFQGDLGPLEEFNSLLGNGIAITSAFVGAMTAATGAIFAFAKASFDAIDPVIQLSRSTGVAVESIQELGFAASVSGSSLEAVQSSIEGLSEKIGEAATKGNEDFQLLGISVRDMSGNVKSADRVLGELRGKFRGLSREEQIGFAQRLGIDRSLIQLLNTTSEGMDELRKRAQELGVVTKEQGDIIAAVNDSYTVLKFAFDGLSRSVALGIAPEMKAFAETMTDFIAANRELAVSIVKWVVGATKELFNALDRLKVPILLTIGYFATMKIAAIGLTGVMSVLGGVFAFVTSPVTLTVAAVTALLLVVDDLIVAFRGGESVIGGFFKETLGVDVVPILQTIVDWVTRLYDSFVTLFTDPSWKNWGNAIVTAWEPFVNLLEFVTDAIADLLGFNIGAVADTIGSALGSVGEFFGFGGQELAAQGVQNNNSASVSQQNNITIEATNAAEAQQGVETALQTSLRDAADFTKRGNLNAGY